MRSRADYYNTSEQDDITQYIEYRYDPLLLGRTLTPEKKFLPLSLCLYTIITRYDYHYHHTIITINVSVLILDAMLKVPEL